MPKLPEEILFDSRLVERHIRKGLTTRKDYDEYLKRVDSTEAQADYLDMDQLASNVDAARKRQRSE